MTKDEALLKIEESKKFVAETDTKKEEKVIGIAIKNRWTGSIIFQSTKITFKEAVAERLSSDADLRDADLRGADLSDANLSGADLRGAELSCAKFYGRGGAIKIMKKDLSGFLGALGFVLED